MEEMTLDELLDMILNSSFDPKDPGDLLNLHELQNRHIWLTEDIKESNGLFIVRMIQMWNRVDNTRAERKPIHIHINSNGGLLSVMFMLYNAIHTSVTPVITYNEGAAHSAAFTVLLAGHKRVATPYAKIVAHEGQAAMSGSFRESKASMKDYERDVTMMKQLISENTTLTMDELNHRFEESQDWYLYPEDMIKYGIVNGYIDDDGEFHEYDLDEVCLEDCSNCPTNCPQE